jgi:hypothetical protein
MNTYISHSFVCLHELESNMINSLPIHNSDIQSWVIHVSFTHVRDKQLFVSTTYFKDTDKDWFIQHIQLAWYSNPFHSFWSIRINFLLNFKPTNSFHQHSHKSALSSTNNLIIYNEVKKKNSLCSKIDCPLKHIWFDSELYLLSHDGALTSDQSLWSIGNIDWKKNLHILTFFRSI